MDIVCTISDPNGILTASNDPTYINREVWIQSLDADAGAYETVKATAIGAGMLVNNYESTVSAYAETDTSTLDGQQFL